MKTLCNIRFLFWFLLLTTAGYTSNGQAKYSEQQLSDKIKQAISIAKKNQNDSVSKAVAQQQATAKTVQQAVTAALAAEGAASHNEEQIGIVSLVANPHYHLYKADGTVDYTKYFKLREMKFYLENGRLLRVYAMGELGIDSIYDQHKPNLSTIAIKNAKDFALDTINALAQERKDQAALEAAKRAAIKGITSKEQARVKRNLTSLKEKAESSTRIRISSIKRAKQAAMDTIAHSLPFGTPYGPDVIVLHKYRSIRSIRFTNKDLFINLNQAATDGTLDVLIPDELNTAESNLSVRFLELVNIVLTSGRRLVTDNDSWTLKPETGETEHRLTAGATLGGLLEVALYTDLLASLNNQPNSLVTTEISSLLPLNQNPIKSNSSLMAFTDVRPFLTLARLDTKFDTLRVKHNNMVNRTDLLQRSYLRFGLNMNLLTFDNRKHVSYHLNGSWTRTISRVAGAVGHDTTVVDNVYQNFYGLEFLVTVRRQRNFGADFYLTTYLHNVQSLRTIENTQTQVAFRPGALFYYYPFGSPNNKLFFRVSNFIFPKGGQRDFVLLQVGYSIGLGNLFQGQQSNGGSSTSSGNTNAHLPSTQ